MIIEKIYEVMGNIEEIDASSIGVNDQLEDKLDSLLFLRMLLGLEAEFGIEFPEDDLNYEKFATLSDIETYISKLINVDK